ncbi:MAG: hypothetical protein AABW67_03245 [Nanoarchaeota archaeon]
MNDIELTQMYKQNNNALINLDIKAALAMNDKIYEEIFERYLAANGRTKESEKSELFKLIESMESAIFFHTQLNKYWGG